MTMRVNVDLEGLELAKAAIRQLEDYASDGFDHASDVKADIGKVRDGMDMFADAFNAALDAANV
jgi:hypothetical protein